MTQRIRIQLYIDSDVHPEIFEALCAVRPRARARKVLKLIQESIQAAHRAHITNTSSESPAQHLLPSADTGNASINKTETTADSALPDTSGFKHLNVDL
jgi:hypothetical protein